MTGKPEVMSGESLDIAAQRRDELKQLFPGVFTETKDADGNVVSSIDFERLKAELGTFSDIYEGRRERYGMEWPGKRDCMKVIQEPSRATLKPCPDESVDWDTTKNLFIEGDNLEVLKLLQKSYYGKVKMIYIDPPYNTGKEFIYPDNYQETLDTYLSYAGLLDDDGKKFSTNTAAEGRYHTKWLNMMYPRLFLARNLLSEDGVIFISIDDNEFDNLLKLCFEIFGEENKLAVFAWKTDGNFDNQAKVKGCHEYILAFAREVKKFPHPPVVDPNTNEGSKLFNSEIRNTVVKNGPKNPVSSVTLPIGFPSSFSKGVIKARNDAWPHYKTDALFENGSLISPVEVSSGWSSKNLLLDFINNNFSPVFDSKGQVTRFEVIASGAIECIKERSSTQSHVISTLAGFGGSQKASSEIEELGVIFDDYPKPTSLIEYLISMNDCDEFTVLDFFAGSGTTAHAVANVNAKFANKNVSCISVQLPEPCKEETKAHSLGYTSISKIAIARISKALEKNRAICNSHSKDFGLKVFKLDRSCFKAWSNEVEDVNQLQQNLLNAIENVHDDIQNLDMLFEILLKAGFEPTEAIVIKEFNGNIVYSIANDALLICLEEKITDELIEQIIALEPMQFICLDKGFQGNDQLKANTAQAFKARSQNSEAEMVFKVV